MKFKATCFAGHWPQPTFASCFAQHTLILSNVLRRSRHRQTWRESISARWRNKGRTLRRAFQGLSYLMSPFERNLKARAGHTLGGSVRLGQSQQVPTMSAYGSCSLSLRTSAVSSGGNSCGNSHSVRSRCSIPVCISRYEVNANLSGCWVFGVDRSIVSSREPTTRI
jgi:hypothetical protein